MLLLEWIRKKLTTRLKDSRAQQLQVSCCVKCRRAGGLAPTGGEQGGGGGDQRDGCGSRQDLQTTTGLSTSPTHSAHSAQLLSKGNMLQHTHTHSFLQLLHENLLALDVGLSRLILTLVCLAMRAAYCDVTGFHHSWPCRSSLAAHLRSFGVCVCVCVLQSVCVCLLPTQPESVIFYYY